MTIIGKRARFSCTVYFARQFDFLRKRCNVDSSTTDGSAFDTHIVRSLERCVGWEAEGGKSKSRSDRKVASWLKTDQ